MDKLQQARVDWHAEKEDYEALGLELQKHIEQSLRICGISAPVTYRTKDVDSLVKKLARKPEHTYQSLPDKLGLRVVCRYRSEVDRLVDELKKALHCDEVDDKSTVLSDDRVGYQSVHLSVRQKGPKQQLRAEVQVRTLAQHLWSEMSHDLVYKSENSDSATAREINLLAGLVEIADNEFARIKTAISMRHDLTAEKVLSALERPFHTLSSVSYDRHLSLRVIDDVLLPLYDPPPSDWGLYIKSLLEKNTELFEHVVGQLGRNPPSPSLFLTQPEVLLIYDRLEQTDLDLRRQWAKTLPPYELECVANYFGKSFD